MGWETLLDEFGDIEFALAAYNCGLGNPKRPVCRNYARRVLRRKEEGI